MTIRHAAALALVGWYLMLPPIDPRMTEQQAIDARLSEWKIDSVYDAADDCNAAEHGAVMKGDRDLPKQKRGSLSWAVAIAMTQAQCVATDDPRLKEAK